MTNASMPTDDAIHLLIVDDDSRIRDLLSRYLSDHGFRVSVAENAASATKKMQSLVFDMAIVDVMMPGQSGTEFTQEVRKKSDIPILMLTALSETAERIEGLISGADDYLSKPFEPQELLLRINNILKRTAKPAEPVIEEIKFGPFIYSVVRKVLTKGEDHVRLTDREQEIMQAFAAKPGATVAREELLGGELSFGERKIDVQINRLRRKIEENPSDPKWLQTVRGVGYRLSVD